MKKFIFILLAFFVIIYATFNSSFASDCSQCEYTDKPTDGYLCYGRVIGTTCDDGLPILCQIDYDCSGSNIVCSNSRCTNSSSLVDSCPENQYLKQGTCFNCPLSAPYHDAGDRGIDYCYKECTKTCDSSISCKNLAEGLYCNVDHTCTGRLYYNSSTCSGTCNCPVTDGCGIFACPDGYTSDDGGTYNTCKDPDATPENSCYKSCESTTENGIVSTSNNGQVYYPQTCAYTYKCAAGYYGTATGPNNGCTICPANATCAGGNGSTFLCDLGYFKNNTSCERCPATKDKDNNTVYGTTRNAGATSKTQCCIPTTVQFADKTGSWEYSSCCSYSE